MPGKLFSLPGTAALMGKYYDRFMADLEEKVLLKRRKQLLSELQGKILEIGTGTGINLGLFPDQSTIIGLEPNPYMLAHAKERPAYLEAPERFHLYNLKAEEAGSILKNEAPFDALVFTLVLCTVSRPENLVRSLLPHLKAGAPIIVLEHIVDPHPLMRFVQRLFNPLWKCCSEGCNLTRSTDKMLENLGLRSEQKSYFRAGLTFYQAVLYK